MINIPSKNGENYINLYIYIYIYILHVCVCVCVIDAGG